MKQTRLVPKGTIQRLRQKARAAWERRDLQECVSLLKRANRMDPANVDVLLQLGRMHGMLYDYESAVACFERAIGLATNRKADILAAAGQQSKDFYNTEIAKSYLERAVQEKGASPEVLVKLADFYERSRRMDEAAELVDRALQMNPNCGPALLARGRLAHRSGRLEEAATLLSPLTGKGDPETRVRAGYELGAVLDRLGRYDEAMTAFLQAKSLLRRDGEPQFAQLRIVRAHLAQMVTQLSSEKFAQWEEKGRDLQPQHRLALLAGHPRSGTTLLEQVLDSHPDIVSAEETNNFADCVYLPQKLQFPEMTPLVRVLDSLSNDVLLSSRRDYFDASEKCLGEPIANRLLIDKNPSMTFMIPSFARAFPEAKILIALRDPRDVVLSCFMQPFVPVHQVSSAYLTLERAAEEYAALMGTWRAIAPLLKNPWIELRYEDMVDDLEPVARKALEFLGVEWDARVLGFDEHARQKTVRSPTYADVTQKVFSRARGRWRNYEKHLSPHLEMLAPFIETLGYE